MSGRGRCAAWLEGPLSGTWCFLGWCLATAVFIGLVSALGGGPATLDTYESVFSTWAIQHGQLACAFPSGFRVIAPVYPLVSGGIAAVGHIGGNVPFPARAALGPHCDTAFVAINQWSLRSGALNTTVWIGYLGWPVLMAGLVALLRASGRGRCGWEPVAVVGVACLPPVWLCIEGTFHPQDLLAMGFALGAMACARRRAWVGAGVLIALAVLSQQFALLIALPLLVLVPRARKLVFAVAAVATAVVISLPLLVENAGGTVHAIVFGTGDTGGIGGTVLWELDLHGALLVLLSRIAPIAFGLAVAWWAVRRLGDGVMEPVPLVAVIALALSFRLVFEQQLFGYYYMALSVSLVVLDVVLGRIRWSLIAWIATVSMVYLLGSDALSTLRPPWLTLLRDLIPLSVILLALLLIALDILGRRVSWMLGFWVAMIAAALLTWDRTNVLGSPPVWFWQVAFVPLGVALAAGPFLKVTGLLESPGQERPTVPPSMLKTNPENSRSLETHL